MRGRVHKFPCRKVSWATSGVAGHVHVQCTNLCSNFEERLEVGISLTWRRVVPILGVPNALVPLSPPNAQINLLPGEISTLWVSVNVPSAQPPSLYKGKIFIAAMKLM
eukprot:Gb_31693 [translate_table: standard]